MAILKGSAQHGNLARDARRAGGGLRARVAAILAAALLLAGAAPGQSVNEYEIKAAFLYNFAKFVEWPEDTFASPADPVSLCLAGGNPFGNILNRTVGGKSVAGHAFSVRQVSSFSASRDCQILFVTGSDSKLLRDFERNHCKSGVLTVGEAPDFTSHGGMIAFHLEHGTVRLKINLAAADAAQMRISSKLLSLAEVVRRSP